MLAAQKLSWQQQSPEKWNSFLTRIYGALLGFVYICDSLKEIRFFLLLFAFEKVGGLPTFLIFDKRLISQMKINVHIKVTG